VAIVFDIVHPADVNFYKNAIAILRKKGTTIEILMRERGNLGSILEAELGVSPVIIGKHHAGLGQKLIHIPIRDHRLARHLRTMDVDVVTGFGNFYIAQAAKLLGKPSVLFYDDIEYRLLYRLSRFSSTRFLIPSSIPDSGRNITSFNGFKELAYLHPRYFTPDRSVLSHLGLRSGGYVFVRDVGKGSLNYAHHVSRVRELIGSLRERELEVVLSIENKELLKGIGREGITVLEEPVGDIHSLMAHASFLVSSGDTMAREACLLGTPSIYTGGRKMAVNAEFLERGFMYHCDSMAEVIGTIDTIYRDDVKERMREELRELIATSWCDVTELIVEALLGFT